MAMTDVTTRRYDSADSLSSFGLLVLRFATGATMVQAGLIKAFDHDCAVEFMDSTGWRLSKFAAILVTVAETAGGVGLLLGLLTPVAACAVIAAMIDAWAVNVSAGVFWSEPFNVPFVVALGATALLFTGAGAFSVDARVFGRPRWPGFVTVGLFVMAIAAAVVTWILLNGTNPIHVSSPAG